MSDEQSNSVIAFEAMLKRRDTALDQCKGGGKPFEALVKYGAVIDIDSQLIGALLAQVALLTEKRDNLQATLTNDEYLDGRRVRFTEMHDEIERLRAELAQVQRVAGK